MAWKSLQVSFIVGVTPRPSLHSSEGKEAGTERERDKGRERKIEGGREKEGER